MEIFQDLPKLQPCVEITHRWWQNHPPVGVFIAVLALVGVLVPWLRGEGDRINRHERAFWTIAMFLCLGLELKSVYQDQADHRNEEAFARCEQLHSFNAIGEGINRSFETNEKHFRDMIDGLKGTLRAATTAVNQTRPQAYLEFTTISPRILHSDGHFDTTIVEGKPIGLNVHYKNAGNDTAEIHKVMAVTYVGKPDDLEEATKAYREFDLKWKETEGLKSDEPLSPGVPAYFTFSTSPITKNELIDIQASKLTVYFIIRLAYRDKTGDWFSDTCLSLQKPADSFLGIEHFCKGSVRGRYRATVWK